MTRLIAITALCAALTCAACTTQKTTPLGAAYHQQLLYQQVTPGPAPPTPVEGLSGTLADHAARRYATPQEAAGEATMSLELGTVTPGGP